jgi:hypothetical protein
MESIDFHEIQHVGHAILGDLDLTLLIFRSFSCLKTADVQTSEVTAKIAPVNVVP